MSEVKFKRGRFYNLKGFPLNHDVMMPGLPGRLSGRPVTAVWHTDSSYLCIKESESECSEAWLWNPNRQHELRLNTRELAVMGFEFEDVSYKGLRIGATVYAKAKTIWGPLAASGCHDRALFARPSDPFLYIVGFDREGDRLVVICSDVEDATSGGDYFSVEDLVPSAEKSSQLPAWVHMEYTPGERYWVSDVSVAMARANQTSRIYVASIGGIHIFASRETEDNYLNGKPFKANTWKYVAAMPKKTVMSLEEVEALLKKHKLILGDLIIKV